MSPNFEIMKKWICCKRGLLAVFFVMIIGRSFASDGVKKDTILFYEGHQVLLKYAAQPIKGTILLLQGWNFIPTHWCEHSKICDLALAKGYNLVMPDMGKSIYHSMVYKETRADWVKYPTRKWLVDSLFRYLQANWDVLQMNERNFVIGLSTGARGALLVAMDCPSLFKGVGALSGDYNQVLMPTDNLCKGYYGDYRSNKQRWKSVDNPFYRIKELKTPIYLGHGLKDQVVPSAQTTLFFKELKKVNPNLKAKMNTPQKAHDYLFWANEVDAMFEFLEL